MAKDVVLSPGKAMICSQRNNLALQQLEQPFFDFGGTSIAAQQRYNPSAPEELAKDAGGAQNAPRLWLQALQASLDHGQHRVGQLLLFRHGANQLFQVKRVAV